MRKVSVKNITIERLGPGQYNLKGQSEDRTVVDTRILHHGPEQWVIGANEGWCERDPMTGTLERAIALEVGGSPSFIAAICSALVGLEVDAQKRQPCLEPAIQADRGDECHMECGLPWYGLPLPEDRTDGDRVICPECKTVYQWSLDEEDVGYWSYVDWEGGINDNNQESESSS